MQINELGIIVNSVSILTCRCDNNRESEFNQDPDLRNSMLDAILKMNSLIWTQDIQSFNFKKYKIVILVKTLLPLNHEDKDQKDKIEEGADKEKHSNITLSANKNNNATSLVFYCIGEAKLKVKFIKSILERISTKFINQFPSIVESNRYSLNIYRAFNPVFEDIIRNLSQNQSRKLKNVI